MIWMVSLGATGTTPRMLPLTACAIAPPENANAMEPPIAKASALRWKMRLREARQELTFMRRALPMSPHGAASFRLSPRQTHDRTQDVLAANGRQTRSALSLVTAHARP